MSVRSFDVFSSACPSRDVLDHVMDRWGALVLTSLRAEPMRFAETARAVGGISDRMLTVTLRTLEADGFVARAEQPGRQRVDYDLTPAGRRVADALEQVVAAIYAVMPEVLDCRK